MLCAPSFGCPILKKLSASGRASPSWPPDRRLCPWTPLGALPPNPIIGSRSTVHARHDQGPSTFYPSLRLCTNGEAPVRCITLTAYWSNCTGSIFPVFSRHKSTTSRTTDWNAPNKSTTIHSESNEWNWAVWTSPADISEFYLPYDVVQRLLLTLYFNFNIFLFVQLTIISGQLCNGNFIYCMLFKTVINFVF